MRIIAVWSLFARWTLRVTESKGCSPHGLKNTSWPTESLEIFSAERQRIPRSGTFIATSEHTLNSVYNQHESRASAAPQGDTEWQTYGNGIPDNDVEVQRPMKRTVKRAWRTRVADLSRARYSDVPGASSRGVEATGVQPAFTMQSAVNGWQAQPVTFWRHSTQNNKRCISASFRQWIL